MKPQETLKIIRRFVEPQFSKARNSLDINWPGLDKIKIKNRIMTIFNSEHSLN